MLGDQLRGEARRAVAWHGELDVAEIATDGLDRVAVVLPAKASRSCPILDSIGFEGGLVVLPEG